MDIKRIKRTIKTIVAYSISIALTLMGFSMVGIHLMDYEGPIFKDTDLEGALNKTFESPFLGGLVVAYTVLILCGAIMASVGGACLVYLLKDTGVALEVKKDSEGIS